MAGTWVIYYPPTTGHPFLVVTFLADGTRKVQFFGKETEAEAFIAQNTCKPRRVSTA